MSGAACIAAALLTPFLRSWRIRWGATDAEVSRSLPGDDLVPHPKWGYTHAISVRASAADIWPWLAQMGQGRGGFYSYELLENLVGCDIHNADRIIPGLQNPKVGDSIRLHPRLPAYPVAIVELGRALVLHARADTQGWGDYRGLANTLGYGPYFMEPIGFAMSRKMLRGIKKRAEGAVSLHTSLNQSSPG